MIMITLSIYRVVWDYERGGEQEPQQGYQEHEESGDLEPQQGYQEHNLELEISRGRI